MRWSPDELEVTTDRSQAIGTYQPFGRSFLFLGLIKIVLGVVALAVPQTLSLALPIVLGVLLAFPALWYLYSAYAFRRTLLMPAFFLVALVFAVTSAIFLFFPRLSLVAITIIAILVFFVEGLHRIYFGFCLRPLPGWPWALFSGGVSWALAIILISQFPEISTWWIAIFLGVHFLISGFMHLVLYRAVQSSQT